MRIALGSDHRGYQLKARLAKMLQERGHEVVDSGTGGNGQVDYTDYAELVSQQVADHHADRGILVCGTGIGMAITANKFPGVRAAIAHDELTAEMCRRHNDVNVLCLSGDMLAERPIDTMIDTWLSTDFEGGRHERRVDKIRTIERRMARSQCDDSTGDA